MKKLSLLTFLLIAASISLQAQRFTYRAGAAIAYSYRSLTVDPNDSMAKVIKNGRRDSLDRASIAMRISADVKYRLSERSSLIGSVAFLNYRTYEKIPGYTIPGPWVHPTQVPTRKHFTNYFYIVAGLGYEHRISDKWFTSAKVNVNFPMFSVSCFKEGKLSTAKTVHRSLNKDNDPLIAVSPELTVGRRFEIKQFPLDVCLSGQYFLTPCTINRSKNTRYWYN